MSAPSLRPVEEQWDGGLWDLCRLLDAAFPADSYRAAPSLNGAVAMISPVTLDDAHDVLAVESRPDHTEFSCSGTCSEELIVARLFNAAVLAPAPRFRGSTSRPPRCYAGRTRGRPGRH